MANTCDGKCNCADCPTKSSLRSLPGGASYSTIGMSEGGYSTINMSEGTYALTMYKAVAAKGVAHTAPQGKKVGIKGKNPSKTESAVPGNGPKTPDRAKPQGKHAVVGKKSATKVSGTTSNISRADLTPAAAAANPNIGS